MAARAPVPMPAQRRPSMTVLDVTALRRTFGGLVAVQGIDFSIAASEVVGFIGPNGSGKSTLFNLLTGVLKPDSGRIRLFGEDIVGRPDRKSTRLKSSH